MFLIPCIRSGFLLLIHPRLQDLINANPSKPLRDRLATLKSLTVAHYAKINAVTVSGGLRVWAGATQQGAAFRESTFHAIGCIVRRRAVRPNLLVALVTGFMKGLTFVSV